MAHVLHPILREGVEARAYQLRSLERILSYSTLMVMPTGFGKTAVEWMTMAEFIRKGASKIVLIAPTTGLVAQQHSMAVERLNLEAQQIITYTGDTPPERRKALWEEGTIVMATPQVIRNDAMSGAIDLAEVELLIMDEAHHATGNHAYAQVGQLYQRSNPKGRVLAATASPGSTMRHITEVKTNLNAHNLDLSKRSEALMQPYDVDMDIHTHRLDLPETILDLLAPLRAHFDDEVVHLQRLGFLAPKEYIGTKDIEKAQLSASRAIQQRDVRGYDAARRVADLRRMNILMNLLQTQGTSIARSFLNRAEEEGRSGRKTNRMLALPVIHQLRLALNDLDELHPKTSVVERLVRKELESKPNGKVLIFTEYRDTVQELVGLLSQHEGILPDVFIGQSSRGSKKGMTQKQQLAQLERFRSGEINTLVATSVGEEGLDVPSADLVVLYEPVPSAVRAIQRRGRTARQRAGSVHVLIANDTRDAYVHRASERQEENMHRLMSRLVNRRTLLQETEVTPHIMDAFSIDEAGQHHPAKAYLERAEKNAQQQEKKMEETLPTPTRKGAQPSERVAAPLRPEQRRAKTQTGLFQFESPEPATPVLNAEEVNIVLNAAEEEIQSLNTIDGDGHTIYIDHREANSTLPGYLNGLGFSTALTQLPWGDVRLSERTLIERKTARDLLDSIKNGRLLRQCRGLKAHARRPLLLIETGGPYGYGLHPNAVLGALAHITLDLGIPVMMVQDAEEAAHFLAVAAQREHDALERLHSFAETSTLSEEQIEEAVLSTQHELNLLHDEKDEPHPWLDDRLGHLHRCFNHVMQPLVDERKDMEEVIASFSPDLGGLFAANVERVVAQTGCKDAVAKDLVSLLHGSLTNQ
jgi:Fanconi anemia group M protein